MAIPEGVAVSTASGILMRMYAEKKVWNQINRKIPVTRRMKKRMFRTHEGEEFRINILTQFSDGGGDRAEWDRVPEADKNEHEWARFNMTRYDRTARWSGESITNSGQIVDVVKDEMDLAMPAAKLDCERSMFLSFTNNLSNIVASPASTQTVLQISNWNHVRRGERIDVLVAATGAVGQGVVNSRVQSITRNDNGTGTITIDPGTATAPDTTFAVFKTNTFGKGFFSLPDIVSASNPSASKFYGGIDRTTTLGQEWQAQEVDAQGASISARLIVEGQTEIETVGDGSLATVFWCHPYVHNDLLKIAKRDSRFPGSVRSFEMWGETVFINEAPVLRSRFCQFDTLYGLNEPNFRWAHPIKNPNGKWLRSGNTSGTVLTRVPNYWGWEALWIWQRQLICMICKANFIIRNINFAKQGTV